MTEDVLGILWDYIRERTHPYRRNESWLAAIANTVRLMSDRQVNEVWPLLQGRPLTVHEADLYQLLAQRLGVEFTWTHRGLLEDDEVQTGAGTYPLDKETAARYRERRGDAVDAVKGQPAHRSKRKVARRSHRSLEGGKW